MYFWLTFRGSFSMIVIVIVTATEAVIEKLTGMIATFRAFELLVFILCAAIGHPVAGMTVHPATEVKTRETGLYRECIHSIVLTCDRHYHHSDGNRGGGRSHEDSGRYLTLDRQFLLKRAASLSIF